MAESRAVVKTDKDVLDNFGKVCAVVGTYQVKEFHNQKGGKMAEWPVVLLKEGTREVLIESLWDASKAPTPETIQKYRGKQVEVVGRLHASPPGRIANMAVPCLSPVESIRILPEPGSGAP